MENLLPTGFRSPDRPARSGSHYQLLYSCNKEIENDYLGVAELKSEYNILVGHLMGDLAIDIGTGVSEVGCQGSV